MDGSYFLSPSVTTHAISYTITSLHYGSFVAIFPYPFVTLSWIHAKIQNVHFISDIKLLRMNFLIIPVLHSLGYNLKMVPYKFMGFFQSGYQYIGVIIDRIGCSLLIDRIGCSVNALAMLSSLQTSLSISDLNSPPLSVRISPA